jgi:hypothetical protein
VDGDVDDKVAVAAAGLHANGRGVAARPLLLLLPWEEQDGRTQCTDEELLVDLLLVHETVVQDMHNIEVEVDAEEEQDQDHVLALALALATTRAAFRFDVLMIEVSMVVEVAVLAQ